jgi:hypothetical protein
MGLYIRVKEKLVALEEKKLTGIEEKGSKWVSVKTGRIMGRK